MTAIKMDDSLDDDMSDSERILLNLTLGRRKPQNEDEENLLKQIKEIKARGNIVDIPAN